MPELRPGRRPRSRALAGAAEEGPGMPRHEEVGAVDLGIAVPAQSRLVGLAEGTRRGLAERTAPHSPLLSSSHRHSIVARSVLLPRSLSESTVSELTWRFLQLPTSSALSNHHQKWVGRRGRWMEEMGRLTAQNDRPPVSSKLRDYLSGNQLIPRYHSKHMSINIQMQYTIKFIINI